MTNFTLQSNVKICLELTNITFSVSSHSRRVNTAKNDAPLSLSLSPQPRHGTAPDAVSLCQQPAFNRDLPQLGSRLSQLQFYREIS